MKSYFTNHFMLNVAGPAQWVDLDLKKALLWVENDFTLRWGRIHRCKLPGCGDTCIADGHTDYRRPICANQENPTYVTHDAIKMVVIIKVAPTLHHTTVLFVKFARARTSKNLYQGVERLGLGGKALQTVALSKMRKMR